MPRKKEYDRDKVLVKAMEAFWKKGYEGTSIQDLVDATHLNRFGMYEEFGSKKGLFYEALDKYCNEVIGDVYRALEEEPQDLSSIRKFFESVRDHMGVGKGPKGCFVANTAIEAMVLGPRAIKRVEKCWDRLEACFEKCLTNSQAKGDIAPDVDIVTLSQYLVGVTQGFALIGRSGIRPERLTSMASKTLEHLSSLVY